LKTLQQAMLRLKRKGYIQYETTRGQRGNFAVFIPKFRSEGAENGGPLPVFDCALTAPSLRPDCVTLTQCTGSDQAVEAKQDEPVAGDSEDSSAHECISEVDWNRTSILTDRFSTAPIQEEQYGQDGQESKKQSMQAASSPPAGTPSPSSASPTNTAVLCCGGVGAPPPRQQAKRQPVKTVSPEDYLPARTRKGTPAQKPSVSARKEQTSVSSVPWNALDFVFELDRNATWHEIPVRELRRVVWYHFQVKPDYWCLPKANLTSEDRLKKVIATMQEQTPDFVKVPGYATELIEMPDSNCQVCSGKGITKLPHPDYPASMRVMQATHCTCLITDMKPWRRIDREAIEACSKKTCEIFLSR
jgi:hypothetical protein